MVSEISEIICLVFAIDISEHFKQRLSLSKAYKLEPICLVGLVAMRLRVFYLFSFSFPQKGVIIVIVLVWHKLWYGIGIGVKQSSRRSALWNIVVIKIAPNYFLCHINMIFFIRKVVFEMVSFWLY